ncbi:hypothetical protein E2C01_080667 [Portunus trituberculatus]|uniref:Uncharacterized protein n=1 Tax=Portunus trituberculatus TaxID=210409 RepID=A0A5B7IYZ3_PORTR|nr:hypothetical protein [Portunus trituberculatus]
MTSPNLRFHGAQPIPSPTLPTSAPPRHQNEQPLPASQPASQPCMVQSFTTADTQHIQRAINLTASKCR